MNRSKTTSTKKFALPLVLLLLTGCGNQAEKGTIVDEVHSGTPPKQLGERQTLDNKTAGMGNLKISLHTKMLEFLDDLTTNEAFAYLNNNSGQVEPLIIVKQHPEIFSHQNKDNYVLCVSAKSNEGDTYPVDIYIKRGIDNELFVYDMRIGDQERKALMALMQKSVFHRF